MKTTASLFTALVVSFGLAAFEAEAAKRFGGGGNTGKQRATPTKEAPATTSTAPAPATPGAAGTAPAAGTAATAAPAAAGAGAAAAAAKPSFMQRWGGMLAGLGIGVLLASLFGAQLGPIIGMLLAVIAVVAAVFLLFRLFGPKRVPDPETRGARFAGIGSDVPPATGFESTGSGGGALAPAPVRESNIRIPGFEVAPFVRVAKTSFIRLQAANDSGDLDDIRSFTTPEMYAEISMQVKERAGAQKTEVVSVDADVLEAVVEDGYEIASVRFWGLIREDGASNPESFDEVWHVQRKANDPKAAWLISGIQQHTP